jgi:hypothetical protein
LLFFSWELLVNHITKFVIDKLTLNKINLQETDFMCNKITQKPSGKTLSLDKRQDDRKHKRNFSGWETQVITLADRRMRCMQQQEKVHKPKI